MRSFATKRKINIPEKLKNRKIIIGIAGIIALLIAANIILGRGNNDVRVAGTNDERIEAPSIKASTELNETFTFRIDGSEVKYTIENAELQDEIIIKGQVAKSVTGKTFLVLNLKVTNNTNDILEVNTRDYIRLSRNDNSSEKIALEIHNDPVLVQPISTKSTRLAIPIKDSDTNLVLHVGEIEGEKREVPINF